MEGEPKTYRKMKGFATDAGQNFEIKLSALLLLLGMKSGSDFQLATNVAGAGAFDDIVFKFLSGGVWHTAFIKLKHKISAKVNRDSLVTLKGDFALAKYFVSYMEIKQKLKSEEKEELFTGDFENCHFAIFTNAELVSWKGDLETRDLPSPVDEYIKLKEVNTSFTEAVVNSLYIDLKKEEEKQNKILERQNKPPSELISSNEEDLKDFLRSVKLVTGQPSEKELDEYIKTAMNEAVGEDNKDLIIYSFMDLFKAWCQESGDTKILDKNSQILKDAVEKANEEKEKLLRIHEKKKNVLVCKELWKLCLILCTSILVGIASRKIWIYVNRESIDTIIQKEAVFQGKSTTLGLILGDHDIMSNELKDLYEAIMASESLVIGSDLKEEISYYVRRTMTCKNVINKEIFSDENYAGRIIVHGTRADVDDFVDGLDDTLKEKFQSSSTGHVVNAFNDYEVTFANDEESRRNGNDTHFLHIVDRILVWNKTQGDINFIKKYINESISNKILDPEGRVVLLIAEPGMGKSTLLAHIARQAKYANPSSWVVNITLNDHTHLLENIKKEDINNETFLFSALRLNKVLDQELFRFSMRYSGNMIIFLDGFDEVSTRYTNAFLALIKNLLTTSVSKVWISSRYSMRNILETDLSTLPLALRKFTLEDQRLFLAKYWGSAPGVSKTELDEFINRLLEMTAQSLNDRERYFTGIPLQTLMLAEVFQDYITNKDLILPGSLNVLQLTEQFVDKKFRTYFKKTVGLRETITDYDNLFEESKGLFIGKHKIASLILIFDETDLQTLHSLDIKNSAKFLENIKIGTDKTGIIYRVVDDGKPIFVHRVFAEYFAALWFSENLNNTGNTKFISTHLLSEEFGVVRHLFDRILARDNELHNAVINIDIQEVIVLLGKGIDVDSIDMGGRTSLHLCVLAGFHNPTKVKPNIAILKLLLIHKAKVNVKDQVLKWTSVQYADSAKLWAEMDVLLNHTSTDITQFSTTKGIIDDHEMWDKVIESDFANVLFMMLNLSQNRLPTTWIEQQTVITNTRYIYTISELLLLKAAYYGSPEVIRRLINRTVNESLHTLNAHDGTFVSRPTNSIRKRTGLALMRFLNARGENNQTALMISSMRGGLSVVVTILESIVDGADRAELVNARDQEGNTALLLATANNHDDIVHHLLIFGANVTVQNAKGNTGLMDASKNNNPYVVVLLLNVINEERRRFQYINTRDKDGFTALLWACSRGYTDIVGQLVKSGANPTDKDDNGWNGLMMAAFGGHMAIIKSLINLVIDEREKDKFVNARENDGNTALMLAIYKGNSYIKDLLIASGANPTAEENIGQNEFMEDSSEGHVSVDSVPWIASYTGYDNNIVLHIAHGAKPTNQDYNGRNGLMKASREGNIYVVKYLINAVNDEKERTEFVNTRDNHGNTALLLVCSKGYNDIVELLIKSGANITDQNGKGQNGLMMASSEGHFSVVISLINATNDERERTEFVNTRDKDGMTALLWASSRGYSDIVELLIASRANPTNKDNIGWNGLLHASVKGHISVVKSLLEAVNEERDIEEFVKTSGIDGNTALWWASSRGYNDIVELLIESGANPTDRNEIGWTGLMIASANGYISVIITMLKAVNDRDRAELVNTRGKDGSTALLMACTRGYDDIVELLITSGANHTDQDDIGLNGLMIASMSGRISQVKSFLNSVHDEREKIEFANTRSGGITALLLASYGGYSDIVELLIASGANITDRNDNGLNGLMMASENGYVSVVKSLLNSTIAADRFEFVNTRDVNGNTALLWASYRGYNDIVVLLIESGANITVQDNRGLNGLMMASENGNVTVVKSLLNSTIAADRFEFVNTRDENGNTALLWASYWGYNDIVELLIESGANITVQNEGGQNGLMLAAENNDISVVKSLLR